MSCIYGPHQFGTEDQGWVAHFLIQAMKKRPITLYGDGKQVRDVLFVEDLVDALLLARKNIRTLSGQVFNLGGGPENTTSLLELLDWIGELDGEKPRISWGNWRPGDQRYYVSNFSKFPDRDRLEAEGRECSKASSGCMHGCVSSVRRRPSGNRSPRPDGGGKRSAGGAANDGRRRARCARQ
jgi:nucleoside-diphosphate-sugar epimerase